jgi:membrane-associated phospholipid phosphatase
MLTKLSIGICFIIAFALSIIAYNVEVFDWEVSLSRWVQSFDLGPFGFVKGWIFWMGVRGISGTVMIVVCVLFWIIRKRLEALFLILISIADVFNMFLKEFIGRPRPTDELVEVVIGYGGIQGSSFPSGHGVHIVLFYGFLLYLARRQIKNSTILAVLLFSGICYMLLSGVWLIYDGRHWFTDVLGGYSYGAFYLLVFISIYRRFVNKNR